MIRSMTGYGRNEAGVGEERFIIEARSLNNRYLDVQIRLPRNLSSLETGVRKAVQERYSRGRIEVSVTRNGEQGKNLSLAVNEVLAERYIGVLRDLKARYGLGGEADLAAVAAFPDVITQVETKEDPEALRAFLEGALAAALDELGGMRADEGAALSRDILERLSTIDRLIASIMTKAPASLENSRKRMTETLARLLREQPEPQRIAQEIAILAERTDVSEELTRLTCHINQFQRLIGDTAEAVGRKLDFLLQEMGREANTIASKALDAEISMDVVNIKAELEKIREQAQNIE